MQDPDTFLNDWAQVTTSLSGEHFSDNWQKYTVNMFLVVVLATVVQNFLVSVYIVLLNIYRPVCFPDWTEQ